jgi:hypothetical protein
MSGAPALGSFGGDVYSEASLSSELLLLLLHSVSVSVWANGGLPWLTLFTLFTDLFTDPSLR